MRPCLSILSLVCTSVAWGQSATQPASQPARNLKFEVLPASEAIAWKGERSPEQIIRPTYAGVVSFSRERPSASQQDAERWLYGEGTDLPGISARQRAFIRQRVYVVTTERPFNDTILAFFAVTQEDARRMATLFIEHLDDRAKRALDYEGQLLQKSVELLEEAPAKIEEYEAKYKQLSEQISERYKCLGIERWDPVKWRNTVDDGNENLRALNIERTGQLARLRAIQEYMAQQTQPAAPGRATPSPASQPNPAVLTALETMLVELNVEMAGTEAKRESIEKGIEPWQEMLELDSKREEARRERERWQQKLDDARKSVEQLPQTLADPPARMRPVQVKDDTVRIVPVKSVPASQASE